MDNNVTSWVPIYKLIRQKNTNQFSDFKSVFSKLATEKLLSLLAIQPEQEIDFVMFCILVIRYASLLIVFLYIGDSINLI